MKNSKGFTLIELVVVIVILGILAAVALPRFINVSKDAHESAVKGTGGALAAAVLLVRSQWEVNRSNGTDTTPNTNVTGFGDGTVDVNASGGPLGTGAALDCVQVWNTILQGSAPRLAPPRRPPPRLTMWRPPLAAAPVAPTPTNSTRPSAPPPATGSFTTRQRVAWLPPSYVDLFLLKRMP